MASEISKGFLFGLSEIIGTTEPALKLLLTVLAGYPCAFLHRKYFYGKDANVQHMYFIISGFLLGYWNYQNNMFHCIATILFTYGILLVVGGSIVSVAITFIFTLSYLLVGYYYTSTAYYDITWTMPQCILVLRLIGIAFDLYDGQQPPETLSKDGKRLALKNTPSILEIFGHCLFPAAFLVGPQFPMKKYQEYVLGQHSSKTAPNGLPESEKAALQRFGLGVLYLTIFQVVGFFVSDAYLLTEEFRDTNFLKKMFLLGLWGRYTLYKYISCWLLAEGACILFGLAYNTEENGKVKWDGVENIKIRIFENCKEFNHYIQSFNVNTNQWIAHYVYKRLKFLGNRHLSQLGALLFLAVWHGLHSGYYICFFTEFLVIYMERDIKSIVQSNKTWSEFFASPAVQLPLQIILRLYTFVFMGWCLLPFGFLKFDKYMAAYRNADYVGAILFCLYPFVYAPILRYFCKPKSD